MGFIRVRARDGLLHEFDISELAYESSPDVYEVLDRVPVKVSRPVKYVHEKSATRVAKKVEEK